MNNKIYPVELKIDCGNLLTSEMNQLASKIVLSVDDGYIDTEIVGEDTIFITGKITEKAYNKIWAILDAYDVTVD